ncbi:MAG: HEAT repeat domain-containing protein [Caldilineaceae bacterium]
MTRQIFHPISHTHAAPDKSQRWQGTGLHRWLRVALLMGLLLSLFPSGLTGAAHAQTPAICAPRESIRTIFLPFTARGGQTVAAVRAALHSEPQAAPRTLAYQVGKTYTYDWLMTSGMAFGTRSAEGVREDSQGQTLIQGVAEIAITGKADTAFVGQVTLRDPWLCSTSDGGPNGFIEDPALAAELLKPVVFQQLPNGVISQVQVPEGMSLDAANILKGILNNLQLTLLATGSSYQASEEGSQGSYGVDYRLTEQPNALAIHKTIDSADFTNFLFQGANTGLELTNRVTMTLDSTQQVISEVRFDEQTNSYDETHTTADPEVGGWDGLALWYRANTSGSLKLRSVTDSPAGPTRSSQHIYRVSSLGTEFGDPITAFSPVDPETADLNAELNALEADPTNPAQSQRLALLLEADATGGVLSTVQSRLQAAKTNDSVARAYIGLLAMVGSPAAQTILAELLTPNSQEFGDGLREQAITGLALQTEPTTASIDALLVINRNTSSPLHDTALLALGSAAGELARTDPTAANGIVADISQALRGSTTISQTELSLIALGNSGHSDVLGLAQGYFEDPSPQVQAAAYLALANIPDPDAETFLIQGLKSEKKSPFVKEVIADALENKKPLSEAAAQTLGNWPPPKPQPEGGEFSKKWDRPFGGKWVGGNLPGEAYVASPPFSPKLEISVGQKAEVYITTPKKLIDFQRTVLDTRAWVEPQGDSQRISYYFRVGKKLVKKENSYTVACAYQETKNIYKNTLEIYETSFTYPVYAGIAVTALVKVMGYYSIDLNYAVDTCAVLQMTGEITFTPSGRFTGEAGVGLKVGLFRGGVSVGLTVMDSQIPAKLSTTFDVNGMKFCANVKAKTKPLGGAIIGWVERKKLNGDWKRFLEWNIWDFSVKSKNYDVLVKCWQKS